LEDPNGTGLVKVFYDHPLVNALFEGTYTPTPQGRIQRSLARVKLPSYIPARTFALVLMDTILPAQTTASGGTAGATSTTTTASPSSLNAFNTLRSNIQKLGNEQVQKALLALVDAADNDVTNVRENIEKWFDSSMDRVSGWYKRRSQIFLLVLGLLVAIAVNADSVLIAQRLSADKGLRDTVVSAAQDYAKANAQKSLQAPSPTPSPKPSPSPSSSAKPCDPSDAKCQYEQSFDQLKRLALPIGWDSQVEGKQRPTLRFWQAAFWDLSTGWPDQLKRHILGWILTALAVSLGAPFWFDLLNKFIVVRSTVKPKEKSPEEKSKD
jgi:hypothetical protein